MTRQLDAGDASDRDDRVAEALARLGGDRQPPAGWQAKVLARVDADADAGAGPRRDRGWLRPALASAVIAAVIGVIAGGLWWRHTAELANMADERARAEKLIDEYERVVRDLKVNSANKDVLIEQLRQAKDEEARVRAEEHIRELEQRRAELLAKERALKSVRHSRTARPPDAGAGPDRGMKGIMLACDPNDPLCAVE